MKKTILSFILFVCSLFGFAGEPFEVMVLMKDHYDRTQLCQKAKYFPTKAERRDFVVKELKAFTKVSQHDLMVTLNALEQQGLVSSIQSLWSANAISFSTTEEVANMLSDRPDIMSISPVKQYHWIPEVENTTEAPLSRSIAPNIIQVNAPQVWDQGNRGQGVVVAVIDTGVNYNHLDIASHLWDGGEDFPNHGFDVYNNDDDPMDDNGHGTHCAGTVCGDGTVGLVAGSAPEATLMCVKCINEEGSGGANKFVKGMEWAVEHGCDVISMSLGVAKAEIADKELLRLSCESILDAGIIAVVPTGNEGSVNLQQICPIPNNVRVPASCPPPYLDPDQMENPGGLSCILAVGAVDENDIAADFTSQGPVTWQDTEYGDYPYGVSHHNIGLIRPDVCAPGTFIWSLDYNSIGDYDFMSGTSQAVPCVAGIVALMLSKNPELTPAMICQILEETSLKLTPTKSNVTGMGRVDALAAVNAVPEWDAVNESTIPFIEMDELNASIQVIDMNGRIVLTGRDTENSISSKSLSPGIYVVRIIHHNKVQTQKIVIP